MIFRDLVTNELTAHVKKVISLKQLQHIHYLKKISQRPTNSRQLYPLSLIKMQNNQSLD